MHRPAPLLVVAASALTLCGCSRSSGNPEIDAVRDRVAAVFGMGPASTRIADAADGAARDAEAAGRSGDPKAMADAVGKGAGKVLCAGLSARRSVAGETAGAFDRLAPDIEHKNEAVTAYRSFVDRIPDTPNPCS